MDIATRKYKFIERFINTINNDDAMELFESLLEAQSKENDTVAYSVEGKPLNKKQYLQEIQEAEKNIAEGRFKTIAQLENEIKNW